MHGQKRNGSDILIVCIIFVLIVLSDILTVLKEKPFKSVTSKNEFHKQITQFVVIIVAVVFMGKLFNLITQYLIAVSIMGICCYVLVLNYHVHHVSEAQKFQDISQFMLRMCIYFRIYQKSTVTLLESSKDAPLWIRESCQKIVDNSLSLQELLQILPHYLMQSMISIFESSESVGFSQTDYQLKRIEQDIESWITQTKLYQEEERKLQNRLLLLFGLGLTIAYFAQNMLSKSLEVHTYNNYQILMLTFIASTLLAIIYASKRMKKKWILKAECL